MESEETIEKEVIEIDIFVPDFYRV